MPADVAAAVDKKLLAGGGGGLVLLEARHGCGCVHHVAVVLNGQLVLVQHEALWGAIRCEMLYRAEINIRDGSYLKA